MSWGSPIQSFISGMRAYWAGVRWLRSHPRYLFYLSIPVIMGLFFFIGSLSFFATYDESILGFVALTRVDQDPWWWHLLYYVSKALLYISVFILSILMSFLMMNIIASPIYEVVSCAVEKEMTGQIPAEISLRGLFKVMVSELKKAIFILTISVAFLLIPGLNLFSTALAAFLIAWDFFDYPLVRRGWTFKQRLRFIGREFWSVLGLGVWMMVPLAQIVTVPLAVAGATQMNLEALKRYNRLTEGVKDHVKRDRE
jgi:CysZ protein